MVLNLDRPGNEGTHWVGLYRQSDKLKPLIYFDSFGVEPGFHVINYADKLGVKYQNEDLQNIDSNRCGFYVLYVLDGLINGFTFKKTLSDFTLNPSQKNIDILEAHRGFHRGSSAPLYTLQTFTKV